MSVWSDDGRRLPLDPRRWHGEPSPLEHRLVASLAGPVLDVGCGPGRIVAALGRLGVAALGVDPAPGAIGLARRRGAEVIQRSVFEPLPSEGGWRTVLLLDGNVGIGGDPVRLLQRCRRLAAPEGSIVAEVQPPGQRTHRCHARLVDDRGQVSSPAPAPATFVGSSGSPRSTTARKPGRATAGGQGAWFRWAVVGADALGALAEAAGLEVVRLHHAGERRWFAHLQAG